MRNLFPGFYDPTDSDISRLWQDGIFVFDTNILLHAYRYSPDARDRLFETLTKLKDRIWIPYQVAYEYQDNRLNVIVEQRKAYDITVKYLESYLTKLKTDLEQFKTNRHAFIDPSSLTKDITKAVTDAVAKAKKAKREHPNYKMEDPLRDRIEELFENKVGESYTKEKLEEKYHEAELRFQRLIPPGLEDDGKKGVQQYGDVIVWFQLMDYARLKKKPILFITDDAKKDWWITSEETQMPPRPRPELVQEILAEASVPFYMYRAPEFMKKAQEFLKLSEKPEVLEEIRDISEKVSKTEQQKDEAIERVLEEGTTFKSFAQAAVAPSYLQLANEIANSGFLQLANDLVNSPAFQLADEINKLSDYLSLQIQPEWSNMLTKVHENLSLQISPFMFDLLSERSENGSASEEKNAKAEENTKPFEPEEV